MSFPVKIAINEQPKKIRGRLHCLIKNYLEDRAQFVYYNSHYSKTQPINIGVPQGSILGPLYFICFL